MSPLLALWRETVWHPDAIPPDEWKFRSLKRLWLPVYDVIAVLAGIWATAFGSPILHRLFDENVIDLMGMTLTVAAAVCLLGVAFPRLWRVEIAGKVILVALLGGYAIAVMFFRANPDPSAGFIVFVLLLALPAPLFRLSLLGEEIKERRDDESES